MRYKVTFQIKETLFPAFELVYSNDGGFYIIGLLHGKGASFSVVKFKTNCLRNGSARRDVDETFFIENIDDIELVPKLAHHASGEAHISGKGIISGFSHFTRDPKGAHIPSVNLLSSTNDGGPIFSFCSWGLPPSNLGLGDGANTTFPRTVIFRNKMMKYGTRKATLIEGYHILKKDVPLVDGMEFLTYPHPIHGEIALKVMPSPESHIGYLGLSISHARNSMQEEHGYYILGGPGMMDNEGNCDNLGIFYPLISFPENESLNFQGVKKEQIIISDKIGKVLTKKVDYLTDN